MKESKLVKKIVSQSKVKICSKNGSSNVILDDQNEGSCSKKLSNKCLSESSSHSIETRKNLNGNFISKIELDKIDELKNINETRRRKKRNKKYLRLTSQIDTIK